jgi:hypothetical protein
MKEVPFEILMCDPDNGRVVHSVEHRVTAPNAHAAVSRFKRGYSMDDTRQGAWKIVAVREKAQPSASQ